MKKDNKNVRWVFINILFLNSFDDKMKMNWNDNNVVWKNENEWEMKRRRKNKIMCRSLYCVGFEYKNTGEYSFPACGRQQFSIYG